MSFDYQIVKASYDKAKPIALDVVTKTFESLFLDFPQATKIFEQANMDSLKDKLVGGLDKIVEGLERLDTIRPLLLELGATHLTHGVKPEYYDWFGQSLLKSLAYFFGDDWDDDLHQAWSGALEVVSEVMKEGYLTKIPAPNLPLDGVSITQGHSVLGRTALTRSEEGSNENLSTEYLLGSINEKNRKAESDVSEQQDTAKNAYTTSAEKEKNTEVAILKPLIEKVDKSDHKIESSKSEDVRNTTEGLGSAVESVANGIARDDGLDIPASKVSLPENLMLRIQKTANTIVRNAIEAELEAALEKELQRYLDGGLSELIKKVVSH
ncbi:MAG: globin domain-containing protein [Bdellovibrionota bacterium]